VSYINVAWPCRLHANVVVAWRMRIDLTHREIHSLILAVEHAKATVIKALRAEQGNWSDDANYLRYAKLEEKLKAIKPSPEPPLALSVG
jgi:hypothetical protein